MSGTVYTGAQNSCTITTHLPSRCPGGGEDFKWLRNRVLFAVLGHKELPLFPSSLFQKF